MSWKKPDAGMKGKDGSKDKEPLKGPSYFAAACPDELKKRCSEMASPKEWKKRQVVVGSVDEVMDMSLDTAIDTGRLPGEHVPEKSHSSSSSSTSKLDRPLSDSDRPRTNGCNRCFKSCDDVCPCSCRRKPGAGARGVKPTR